MSGGHASGPRLAVVNRSNMTASASGLVLVTTLVLKMDVCGSSNSAARASLQLVISEEPPVSRAVWCESREPLRCGRSPQVPRQHPPRLRHGAKWNTGGRTQALPLVVFRLKDCGQVGINKLSKTNFCFSFRNFEIAYVAPTCELHYGSIGAL